MAPAGSTGGDRGSRHRSVVERLPFMSPRVPAGGGKRKSASGGRGRIQLSRTRTRRAKGRDAQLGDESETVIALAPGATFEGRVVDAAGNPVARAFVTVDVPAPEAFERQFGPYLTMTEEDGSYRIARLPDAPMTLKVTSPLAGSLALDGSFRQGERVELGFVPPFLPGRIVLALESPPR